MKDVPDKTYLRHSLFDAVEFEIARLDPGLCVRGTFQTRTDFAQAELDELADSLSKTGGNYNPVVVRPRRAYGNFEIIAGERRVRASQLAGLPVLALIGEFTDEQAAVITLTENLQREDLNAIEEAEGLARMATELALTHAQIAELIGKSRIYVTNTLRLLNLDLMVRDMIRRKALSAGHGKVMVTLNTAQQRQLAQQATRNGWSVRKLEEKVREILSPTLAEPPKSQDRDIALLEDELSDTLGQPCRIHFDRASGGGELKITFFSPGDFEGVLKRLGKSLSDQ